MLFRSPTMTSLGFTASNLASSSSPSSTRTRAMGKFLGPPRSGFKARGFTGTRSTCLSLYVKASCARMPVPTTRIPTTEETQSKLVTFATVFAFWKVDVVGFGGASVANNLLPRGRGRRGRAALAMQAVKNIVEQCGSINKYGINYQIIECVNLETMTTV